MSETVPAEVIVGVDTHKHIHAAVAITVLGARLGTMAIPVSTKGYRDLEIWARSFGAIRAFGVEGTGSYGAGLSPSSASRGMPSARSIAPIASCATTGARATPSMLRAPPVRC